MPGTPCVGTRPSGAGRPASPTTSNPWNRRWPVLSGRISNPSSRPWWVDFKYKVVEAAGRVPTLVAAAPDLSHVSKNSKEKKPLCGAFFIGVAFGTVASTCGGRRLGRIAGSRRHYHYRTWPPAPWLPWMSLPSLALSAVSLFFRLGHQGGRIGPIVGHGKIPCP